MENTQQYIKSFSSWREERAKAILEKGNPQILDEFTYFVPSQSSDKKYKVTHIDAYSCNVQTFKTDVKAKGYTANTSR
ncbi:hypothetical protein HYV89_04535 [Candidatus Woesearchaeota archaeon]|nr:hypothetical protein [Candidatus Woesearchaeota archaeon]